MQSLLLKNFTAFKEAEFSFTPGLNVIVGENGTGKSHVLKVAYSAIYACGKGNNVLNEAGPTKAHLQLALADKLNAVFKPDSLGRLVRRDHKGRKRCEVEVVFSHPSNHLVFSFSTVSKTDIVMDALPSKWIEMRPVYIPTRELLTIYPGFVSLYETTHLSFDETWRDTCILLGAPLARGPRVKEMKKLLDPLEDAMGGKVELTENGGFYLNIAGLNMEMHLVAEGLRKFAMIARLIATGSLIDKGFLFWDEPEANLNPKILKVIARTVLELSKSGIQIFIASHSLFLLRELDILLQKSEYRETKTRFFGLHRDKDTLIVRQGDTMDDIGMIDVLEESLSQSDRYLEGGRS